MAFIFVIFFIGLPLWWKTTQVYRVALPYDEILRLNEQPIKIVSNIGIYTNSLDRSQHLVEELNKFYHGDDLLEINFYQIVLDSKLTINAKTPAMLEGMIIKRYPQKIGDFILYEWSRITEDVLVTSDRSALISKNTSPVKIQKVLDAWIYQPYKLKVILAQTNQTNDFHIDKSLQTRVNFKGRSHPEYDVLISVMNPRPDIQDLRWNVQAAAEYYLQPFLNDLGLLSNFILMSQWKYQISFDFPTKQIPDDTVLGRHFLLPNEYFPHIITSIERKLGNAISHNPCYHLVVYAPPCENAPLHTISPLIGGNRSTWHVDSFLSPQWGGIVIANPPTDQCAKYMEHPEPYEYHINTPDVMQVILYQLRKLLDIESGITIPNCNIVPLESVRPRAWEVDGFLRSGCVEMIGSSILTLQSLIKLLDNISNIVINDKVGAAIIEAYTNINLAKKELLENNLHDAVIYAKRAHVASEAAFFDPTMLSLLYFPDDQKYAIYIPLFLPVMLPVVLSLTTIFKYVTTLIKSKKLKSE